MEDWIKTTKEDLMCYKSFLMNRNKEKTLQAKKNITSKEKIKRKAKRKIARASRKRK